MNLILFEPTESLVSLPRSDRRSRHLLEVLHRRVGDEFDAGIINGPRGKGRIVDLGVDAITFAFEATADGADAAPITLIVGLPRPQTARDILRDATTLGVEALHFVRCDRGEPNYAQSSLWTGGEWRRQMVLGAEQAFCTRLPEVTHELKLPEAIANVGANVTRLALDNYEPAGALSRIDVGQRVAVCVGPERGWSPVERGLLRHSGFTLVHLGTRVLRTETACVAALTLVRAKLGVG